MQERNKRKKRKEKYIRFPLSCKGGWLTPAPASRESGCTRYFLWWRILILGTSSPEVPVVWPATFHGESGWTQRSSVETHQGVGSCFQVHSVPGRFQAEVVEALSLLECCSSIGNECFFPTCPIWDREVLILHSRSCNSSNSKQLPAPALYHWKPSSWQAASQ